MQSVNSGALIKAAKSLSHFPEKKWKQKSSFVNTPTRSNSLLTKNLLTKSYFSLNDTSFNRLVQKKSQIKSLSHRKSTAELLYKYNRQISNNNRKIQRVNSETIPRERKPSIFFENTTQKQHKLSIPKFNFKKINKEYSQSSQSHRFQALSNPRNKFKLLFKEQKKRLSVSQKKIIKLDKKIQQLRSHRQKMQKMIPVQKKKQCVIKPKPCGVIISKQKIERLIDNLITNSEGLFHTFIYPKKVGSKIRQIQGYNKNIQQIFMQDQWRAKRLTDRRDLQQLFWIFKPQSERTVYFGQEDQTVYTLLNNFNFKLQKLYHKQKRVFGNSQGEKIKNAKFVIAKQFQKFQRKGAMNQKMTEITKFVENRRIHNQQTRQKDMKFLQKLGIRFNITERTKGLLLIQRQNAMKRFKLQDFKNKNLPL